MKYTQEVSIKKSTLNQIKKNFQEPTFIKFLIIGQPVKILKWEGIKNNMEAQFKIWLFKWHTMSVYHSDFESSNNSFQFKDHGKILPFGLISWLHIHRVYKKNDHIIIKDELNFKHKNNFLGIFIYPIMVFPIVIRKILYPVYFKFLKK